ncbi:innexin inx7-like isoform X2 [Anthonomus grandis grandis]|uniref:innexin inx7-like isoform X2 n=1 Tax=Anthonomus grandis grandis TaxID=2921223 RepID=UPI002165BF6F|nr:innexin inx7-like isoform X2 [Anthonomus grandis grandis]
MEPPANMLKSFEGIAPFVKKLAAQTYSIDNWVFKLHYRITFTIFMVSTILVCSRQYIGEHIHCMTDKGSIPPHVMNTFCFFTSTFTMVKDLNAEHLDDEFIPHPGVGPMGVNSKEEVKRHAYYQWVPFVLFGQGIMFVITHQLWKKLEGGRIKYLVDGLQLAAFSLQDKNIKVSNRCIPTKQERDEKIKTIRKAFIERIYISGSWSINLMICEALNLLNVICQIYITNTFLNGQFLHLGADVVNQGLESSVDPLDEVFPKVTKCTFQKYGPSGTIQNHDALCVMALNVVNDKIYTFLWFWYILLFICTALGLIWRFVTILLHARSKLFNKIVFAYSCPGKISPWDVLTVSKYCSYTDWLFLKYLAKNLDGLVFREIIISLAEELEGEHIEPAKQSLLSSNASTAEDSDYKIEYKTD